jgi:hypothetical protein
LLVVVGIAYNSDNEWLGKLVHQAGIRLSPEQFQRHGRIGELEVTDSGFSEVQARHWEQFAAGVGFTKAQAKRRILELAKLLPATARELQSDPGHCFAGNAVVEQINTLIEQRCALTVRRLTSPAAENDTAAEPAG